MADTETVVVPKQEVALEAVEKKEVDPLNESKPEDVPLVEGDKPAAETEVEAAVEKVPEVKQEVEPAKEESPAEVIKEPEAPAEAENEKQVETPSVVEDVSEKAVVEEALEDKKEGGQGTVIPAAAEGSIAKEVIEDKAVVEEVVKDESGKVAEDEKVSRDLPVMDKPEKKQSRNVISKMKRSFSKVKKAFTGKSPANTDAKADEKAK